MHYWWFFTTAIKCLAISHRSIEHQLKPATSLFLAERMCTNEHTPPITCVNFAGLFRNSPKETGQTTAVLGSWAKHEPVGTNLVSWFEWQVASRCSWPTTEGGNRSETPQRASPNCRGYSSFKVGTGRASKSRTSKEPWKKLVFRKCWRNLTRKIG